jgi:hypothetical protein
MLQRSRENEEEAPAFLEQASACLESIDRISRRDDQNRTCHHPRHGDQLQLAPFPDAAENIVRRLQGPRYDLFVAGMVKKSCCC